MPPRADADARLRTHGAERVRSKNGQRLEFALLHPSSIRARAQFAVLIQEQLRQVGVKVNVQSLDFSAFMARASKHDFDAILDGLHTGPSPSCIRASWASVGIAKGSGPNDGEYSSPAFDAQVDSALGSTNAAGAKAHFRAAYQTIVDDAPATWLFEPIAVAGVNRRLSVGTLRADKWWLDLPTWTIRQR